MKNSDFCAQPAEDNGGRNAKRLYFTLKTKKYA